MAQNKAQQQELTALFAKYNIRIGMLYGKFIKELSKLGYNVEDKLSEDALFLFDNFPELKTRLNDIFRQYVREQMLLAQSGIQSGVGLAFGQDAKTLHGYTVLNDEAIQQVRNMTAQAFLASRLNTPNGLNLSQKVWNYAEQTKSEFEMAMSNVITDGLEHGTSAAELSRRVRDQLVEPEMMYRRYHHKVITKGGAAKDVVKWHKRIIDEEGHVRFVETPLEEVGQGVYRSSYKNTFRLMRTEINMSYHYANCERWKNEPFVLGIRIWGSPQHPRPDICDELWGDYPKDFMFSGFHPQCLCACAAITATREEIREYHRRKRAGEDVSHYECKGTIKDVPQQYKDYVQQHKAEIQRAGERGTLAYVFRDNPKYLGSAFGKEQLQEMGLQQRGRTPDEAKVWRHAQRDDAAVQQKWNEYQLKRANTAIKNAGLNSSSPVLQTRLTALKNAISSGNKDAIKAAYAEIWHGIQIQQLADARHAKRSDMAVKVAWYERQKEHLQIVKTARSVLAVSDKLAFVDTASSSSLLRDLLLQYKLKEAANLTKTLAKRIAEVKKKATALQYIQDAQQHLKKVSIAELKYIDGQIAAKVSQLESKWGSTNYAKLEQKYLWEAIDYLGANMGGVQNKYPDTWQISQQAYFKLADKMKEMPLWQNLQTQLATLKAYSATSPKYWKEVAAAEAAVLAKSDLTAAQAAVKVAEKHMKDLESQRKSYNKKKRSNVAATVLGAKLTDAQLFDLTKQYVAAYKAGKSKLTAEETASLQTLQNGLLAKDADIVRTQLQAMGVDLDNAYSQQRKDLALWCRNADDGDDYFRPFAEDDWARWNANEKMVVYCYTSGSAYINEPFYTHYLATKYDANGVRRDSAADIDTLTKMIDGSVPFTRDVWLNRGDSAGSFKGQFGFDLDDVLDYTIVTQHRRLARKIEDKEYEIKHFSTAATKPQMEAELKQMQKDLQDLAGKMFDASRLVGKTGIQKPFMSTAHTRGQGFVGDGKSVDASVVYNIYCPAGTKGIYTEPYSAYGYMGHNGHNWDGHSNAHKYGSMMELEVLLQQGTQLRITRASYNYINGKYHWIIDMEVIGQTPAPPTYI